MEALATYLRLVIGTDGALLNVLPIELNGRGHIELYDSDHRYGFPATCARHFAPVKVKSLHIQELRFLRLQPGRCHKALGTLSDTEGLLSPAYRFPCLGIDL